MTRNNQREVAAQNSAFQKRLLRVEECLQNFPVSILIGKTAHCIFQHQLQKCPFDFLPVDNLEMLLSLRNNVRRANRFSGIAVVHCFDRGSEDDILLPMSPYALPQSFWNALQHFLRILHL